VQVVRAAGVFLRRYRRARPTTGVDNLVRARFAVATSRVHTAMPPVPKDVRRRAPAFAPGRVVPAGVGLTLFVHELSGSIA
jgi:hypothetical protein